jgi:hypothetical protein
MGQVNSGSGFPEMPMALGDILGASQQGGLGNPGTGAGSPLAPSAAGRPGVGGAGLAALTRNLQGAQPTAQGPGNQADSMTQISGAAKMMAAALMGMDPTNPLYGAVATALKQISRHLAKGSPTAGTEMTMFQDMARQSKKNALLQMISQQQGGRGGQAPQPGMPAAPLPGA